MPRPLSMWRASSPSVLAPREAKTSMPGGFISPVQIKIKRAPTGLAPWGEGEDGVTVVELKQ